jgi:hypothetical protein
VAGPRSAALGELAREWARARRRRVLPVPLPLPRSTGRPLRRGALVPAGDAITGGPSFGEWLRAVHSRPVRRGGSAI